MKVLKGNIPNLDNTINSQLLPNEKVIKKFSVVPLDLKFEKIDTCFIILTNARLFVTYDQVIEIYDLKDTVIDKIGVEPTFTLYGSIITGSYNLRYDFDNAMSALKQAESLFKLSIYEENTVPKDFILTADGKTARNYQTWAMYQIIKSTKNEGQYNPILDEIVKSSFADYNPTLLLRLLFILLGFVVVKVVSAFFYNFWFSLVINIVLGSFLIYMSYRVFVLYQETLKKYERVYLSFKV
ncbi:MAG TPA: hypothetical protein VHA74_01670 [Candidatus Dojkabacteria bacterium]|nr:hypothetical protein [Candidatus Dojkabacteria bacterium]